jgi:hypothetical protein
MTDEAGKDEAAKVADEARRANIEMVSRVDPAAVEFLVGLVKESDRGAILVLGTYLEGLLEQLLSAALGGAELFDDFNAPLGTFSAKIKAVHALGLVSDEFAFNLDQIRRARNHCAHHIENVTFDDQKVMDHVRNLKGVGSEADERWKEKGRPRKLWIMGRLGFFLGAMMGWVEAAKPIIERGDTRRTLEALRVEQAKRNAKRLADAEVASSQTSAAKPTGSGGTG